MSFPPLLLLHLSDLHFGSGASVVGDEPSAFGRTTGRDVLNARDSFAPGLSVAAVVVTGDVADAAKPSQYQQATQFLGALSDTLEVPRRRFVFCPGNHDVAWNASKNAENDQQHYEFDDAERRRRTDARKLSDFQDFVREFWEVEQLEVVACRLTADAWLVDIDGVPLSIAVLNSCEAESHREDDHLGVLGKPQCDALRSVWTDGLDKPRLRVVAVHHNPVATTPANAQVALTALLARDTPRAEVVARYTANVFGMEGRDALQRLATDKRVSAVLHGHIHATTVTSWQWPKGGQTQVLGAGSLGQLSGAGTTGEPNALRLVVLDPGAGFERRLRARTLIWNPDARTSVRERPGEWLPGQRDFDDFEGPIGLPEGWPTSPPQDNDVDSGDSELRAAVAAYLHQAAREYSEVSTVGFGSNGVRVPLDLDALHVPLRAIVDLRLRGEARCFADADDARTRTYENGEALTIDLNEAFGQTEARKFRGLVLLGDPGSGKTTHLKRALVKCCCEGSSSLGLPADLVPVILPLRSLRDLPNVDVGAEVQREAEGAGLTVPPWFGKRLAERGRMLLLLDGLDEVPRGADRLQVARWIDCLATRLPLCRFAITCRFAGFSSGVRAALGTTFLELQVQPLANEQARQFVGRWYARVEAALAPNPAVALEVGRRKAADLWECLAKPEFRTRRVFSLTRNPLLLGILCVVHRSHRKLPERRVDLYAECVDVLLQHWRAAKGLALGVDAEAGRQVLQPAALWLHTERQGDRSRATATDLRPVLQPVLDQAGWTGRGVDEFLDTVHQESGLLVGWGDESYGFSNLGFQEYLAACEVHRQASAGDERVLRVLAQHSGDSWWQEVALLLVALEKPSLFERFMGEVVKQPAFAAANEFVRLCLDDAAEVSDAPFAALVMQPPGREPELWSRQLAALHVLTRLESTQIEALKARIAGHPSPAIQEWLRGQAVAGAPESLRLDPSGYELVRIPSGTFLMGSPDTEVGRAKWEGPQREVTVAEFYLGRYPVTNEEYERFLAANPNAPAPAYWGARGYCGPRQPVVGVSWEDAQRFAAWAGLVLPSEAQWEYACRAGSPTPYCNGEKVADLDRVGYYGDNSGLHLHDVGEKESNKFGLYDMHGGVWEWCADDFHRHYRDLPSNGQAWVDTPRSSRGRVLRGGSWLKGAGAARAASRDGCGPSFRDTDFGFRLALHAAPNRTVMTT